MDEQVTKDTLLRELRRLNLYPPEVRQLGDLRAKLESRVNESTAPQDDFDITKYGVLLYGIAVKSIEQEASESRQDYSPSAQEDSTPYMCIDALCRMGVCGRTMAAAILCNRLLPLYHVRNWFEGRSPDIAISVADRMLALSPDDVDERIKVARSVIEKASGMSRDEATAFFRINGTRNGEMTFSTLECFMSGTYGNQCRKSLNEPESLEEISACAESMPSYPEKELVLDVAFHLRTMDPIIMKKVLSAVKRLADEVDDRTLKDIAPLAMSPSIFLAKAAMDVIAKFGGSRRGRIFARVFNESIQTRAELINRLPLLSSDNFNQFMNSIPKEFQGPVISTLFSTLSDEDSHCFGAIVSSVLRKSKSSNKGRLEEALKDIFLNDTIFPPEQPAMDDGRTMPGVDFIKLGAPIVLNVMKKKNNTGFTRIFGKEEETSDGLPDIYTDGQISNQHVHKLNRWKSRAKEITFQNCTFSASDFKEIFMEKCIFKKCTFESCTFADGIFSGCSFTECTFKSSTMNNSYFQNCRIDRCFFNSSNLDSATFYTCSFSNCDFNYVSAPGALFHRSGLKCCGLHVTDLREVYFYKTGLKGVSFSHCDFKETLFSSGEAVGVDFTGSSIFGCKALNMKTESPAILKAMYRTLSRRLGVRERLKKKSKAFPDINRYELQIQNKVVKLWFAFKDIQRAHAAFAENNTRRLKWAGSRMSPKGSRFLALLPALLHTTVFERATSITDLSVPSRIKNYHVSHREKNLLKAFFNEVEIDSDEDSYVPIEALMSIGSTGTIAQSTSSDLDCWVCCDFSKTRGDSRERLQFKLKAIEEWAESDFNLEVHFFVMDVREIRNNRFGLSDEESSGSAQSAILKEEFYRTALLIAGKPPVWWFSRPDASDKDYADTLRKLNLLKGREFAVDLGNVPHIPIEEFFGASLWQIVKGVKSPFKSIMKFGLLEMYTSGHKSSLLCEVIKRNILDGMRRLRRVDPYMLLYKDLADFYTAQGNPEYTWLTAMALRLKCGLVGEKGLTETPKRPEDREIIEFATGLAGKDSPGAVKGFINLSDFRSVIALGDKINQFMIKTYMKVRGEQDKTSASNITPEDLTRLGRVIFSNFAKRQNKIERITLPGSQTHFFDSLIITRDKKKTWFIQGEYHDESGARLVQTDVESGKNLTCMLVWAALNGLYTPEMKIKTDMTSTPVRDKEVSGLFESLVSFFPGKEVFNTPVDEALNPEQVTRAFFIINFCVPRENPKVREVHLVYSTNWGEVFCKQIPATPVLVEAPETYLRNEMPELCSGPIKMNQFVPQGSVCPFLKIPVE